MKALLRKILVALVVAAILSVSAGVVVVSSAFALYALVLPPLGPAGAAAVVALAAILFAALVAVGFETWLHGSKPKPEPEPDLIHKVMGIAKDRPIVSVAGLIGAAALAIRNPALMAIVVKAFLDSKGRPQGKKAKS